MTATNRTTPTPLTIRRATDHDWDAIALLDAQAFGITHIEEDLAETRRLTSTDAIVLACDGDRPVGVTMHFPMTVTVPGGAGLAATGVSWVSVAPTHRRRGALRAMFTHQHAQFQAAGAPLSVLTASEATIYERFGYGPATTEMAVVLDRNRSALRPHIPDEGGVALVDTATARTLLPGIYQRWHQITAGAQAMPSPRWERTFADRENRRDGLGPLFYAVHDDGYATFRRGSRNGRRVARVEEFVAVTDLARAALWRVLCSLDLLDDIEATIVPEDPLTGLLSDRRAARVTGSSDGMWVRLMDIAVALSARTYSIDVDLVLCVDDPFLTSGGLFRLHVRDGEGAATRLESADVVPDVTLPLSVLSSIYLGGHRLAPYVASGAVTAPSAAAIRALDLAFATDRAPQMGWFF